MQLRFAIELRTSLVLNEKKRSNVDQPKLTVFCCCWILFRQKSNAATLSAHSKTNSSAHRQEYENFSSTSEILITMMNWIHLLISRHIFRPYVHFVSLSMLSKWARTKPWIENKNILRNTAFIHFKSHKPHIVHVWCCAVETCSHRLPYKFVARWNLSFISL